MYRPLAKFCIGRCLFLHFHDRKWFFYGVLYAFRIWREIIKTPLYFFNCGSFWFFTSVHLSIASFFLGGREGCTGYVSPWSDFKNVKDASQSNNLLMFLKKVSDVSKVVLMYCLIILWFFLMVTSYFQTTNLMLVSAEARSPWRHWCLKKKKNCWVLGPKTFQSQMLKLKKNIPFWALNQTQYIFST